MKRRDFLRSTLGGAAGTLVLSGCEEGSKHRANREDILPRDHVHLPMHAENAPDLEFELIAAPGKVSLMTGRPTEVWRYNSRLLQGPPSALVENSASYLGPTLRVKRGQQVRIHFENAIGEPSIIHWHGLYVSERNDGHPSQVVASGQQYLYDFKVENRAGTYWYHAHPADRTGPQVYNGLAGLLLVSDEDEERLGLPDGDREHTLVLQDRSFGADNQLIYSPHPMIGFLGEQLLVNGEAAGTKEVPGGPHRLRILNGSNSRVYDLAWSDGSPLTVIGTDGGLLAAPMDRAHVLLAPGQRLDVWADFGGQVAQEVWLESRAFTGLGPTMANGRGMGPAMGRGMGPAMGRGMGPAMGRGMGPAGIDAGLANGAPLRIQRFVATRIAGPTKPPHKLVANPGPALSEVSNPGNPRTFTTTMRMMQWMLNGRSFDMRSVADNERVRLGTVEDWEFQNPGGPMSMAHPIHLHGPQFQIVERRPGPGLADLRAGLHDAGWQDTFLLLPGDRVRIRVRFDRHPGMFLYHCHNLEHEDMGMMRNYLVETS